MEYKPHEYQKYAIDFIETHPQAAVLLGCGLGKTSITLTALNDLMFDSFVVRKPLIIAPIRVCNRSDGVDQLGHSVHIAHGQPFPHIELHRPLTGILLYL